MTSQADKNNTRLFKTRNDPKEKHEDRSNLSRNQAKVNKKDNYKTQKSTATDNNPFSDLLLSNLDNNEQASNSDRQSSINRRRPLVLDDDYDDFGMSYKQIKNNNTSKRNIGLMEEEDYSLSEVMKNNSSFDDYSTSQNFSGDTVSSEYRPGSWSVDKNGAKVVVKEEVINPKKVQKIFNNKGDKKENAQKPAVQAQECSICLGIEPLLIIY